jgi:hypothetical protein
MAPRKQTLLRIACFSEAELHGKAFQEIAHREDGDEISPAVARFWKVNSSHILSSSAVYATELSSE